jgi:uncharacterized membrane protein
MEYVELDTVERQPFEYLELAALAVGNLIFVAGIIMNSVWATVLGFLVTLFLGYALCKASN